MALQLLKRNYTMHNSGYEKPKILKLPQGEFRWAPKRTPVDVGDVMMNLRMNDSKTKFIGESVSKYAQGRNPYGQSSHPYKVNKQFRPPIIDPKLEQPLSRMPVKFDAITVGPIVKNLYQKKVNIDKVAPKHITDRLNTEVHTKISDKKDTATDKGYREGEISLKLKQPHASIPYHPSKPYYRNTGVPDVELDPKLKASVHAGVHGPYHHSDQSRDIRNLRTPMHVALNAGYKDPHTSIQINPGNVDHMLDDKIQASGTTNAKPLYTVDPVLHPDLSETLTPKVSSSAWYNPSYELIDTSFLNETDVQHHIGNKVQTSAMNNKNYTLVAGAENDQYLPIQDKLKVSAQNNVSGLQINGELGEVHLPDALHQQSYISDRGSFVPEILEHPVYSIDDDYTKNINHQNYYFIDQDNIEGERPQMNEYNVNNGIHNNRQNFEYVTDKNYIEDIDNLNRAVTNIREGRFVRHQL